MNKFVVHASQPVESANVLTAKVLAPVLKRLCSEMTIHQREELWCAMLSSIATMAMADMGNAQGLSVLDVVRGVLQGHADDASAKPRH